MRKSTHFQTDLSADPSRFQLYEPAETYRYHILAHPNMSDLCIPRRTHDRRESGPNEPRADIQMFWYPFTDPALELVSHVPPELAIARCGMMVESFQFRDIDTMERSYFSLFEGLRALTLARRLWTLWSAPGSYTRFQARAGQPVPVSERSPCPHWHPNQKEPDNDSSN